MFSYRWIEQPARASSTPFRTGLISCLSISAAALLAGLGPAWHASRSNLTDSLKSNLPDPGRARMRTLLTITQVAIGTLVLAVSALLVSTLHRLATAPAGFDRDHVVTFTMDTEFARYTPEQNRDLIARLEREAREPHVTSHRAYSGVHKE